MQVALSTVVEIRKIVNSFDVYFNITKLRYIFKLIQANTSNMAETSRMLVDKSSLTN